MITHRLFLLPLLLLAVPAAAQTSPSEGVLQLPKSGSTKPAVPATPPQAAPVAPVERSASPAGERHPTRQPGHGKAPVVQAHRNPHAVKPASASKEAESPLPTPPVPAQPPDTPAAAAPAAPPPKFDPNKGTETGLPLPRWVSLRADEVNLRTGPGMRYPIDWEYHRRDLPVQILREFEVWRLVQDQDSIKGWVHQATLSGRRAFVVTGAERTMRDSASDNAAPVARLMPGVVGRIRRCDAGSEWCEVQVESYRGWLKREEFWGTFPGEAVVP